MGDANPSRATLTKPQEVMLRQVVATNGGGVHAGFHEGQRETRILRKLESLGLVQGKAGSIGWAVHTRDGLKWVRAADRAEASVRAELTEGGGE